MTATGQAIVNLFLVSGEVISLIKAITDKSKVKGQKPTRLS